MSFLEKALNDKRVIALQKALKRGAYHVDIESFDQEIDRLHLSRQVRTLKTTELLHSFQKKFIDASLQNQAYRSRLVEISVKCYRISAKLEEHLAALKGHLKTKYPKALSAYRTQADRNAAVDSILEEPKRYLKKLERTRHIIDMIISDIDAAGWTLKSVEKAANTISDIKTAKF